MSTNGNIFTKNNLTYANNITSIFVSIFNKIASNELMVCGGDKYENSN